MDFTTTLQAILDSDLPLGPLDEGPVTVWIDRSARAHGAPDCNNIARSVEAHTADRAHELVRAVNWTCKCLTYAGRNRPWIRYVRAAAGELLRARTEPDPVTAALYAEHAYHEAISAGWSELAQRASDTLTTITTDARKLTYLEAHAVQVQHGLEPAPPQADEPSDHLLIGSRGYWTDTFAALAVFHALDVAYSGRRTLLVVDAAVMASLLRDMWPQITVRVPSVPTGDLLAVTARLWDTNDGVLGNLRHAYAAARALQ